MKKYKLIFLLLITFNYLLPIITFAQQGSMDWSCETTSPGWSARSLHTSVVFNNMIWVIGGTGGGVGRNDVWSSSNGVNWIRVTESVPWLGRHGHTSVVFDNRMWLIGGSGGTGNYNNDVWYSYDGANWICATSSAQWPGREGHTSVVFDGKIWVLGGYGSANTYYHDVWYSTDGANWIQATNSAQWSARFRHKSVIFDNKIWVLGGLSSNAAAYNDVWYSTNGADWFCATSSAGWAARLSHSSFVFDNKIWVLGGGGNGFRYNDVWYSVDGVNWVCAIASAGWAKRLEHTSVIFDDKIWLIGGRTGAYTYVNDVWSSRNIRFTLISPNGYEDWMGGSSQLIKWRTIGNEFGSFRILLSRNDSTYSDTIAYSIAPSETSCNWIVPPLNSIKCRVKLQLIDTSGAVMGNDVSDTNFTIRTINIISPNGGDVWDGGSRHIIRWWRSPYIMFSYYRLLLSQNNGVTYTDTIVNNLATTETTYNWTVPSIHSTKCRVMIQMIDAANSVISQDVSDSNFTIRTIANIISPNGGELWPGGSNQIIKWRTFGTGFAGFYLFLSYNGGSTYTESLGFVASTETTYNWIVPLRNSNACRIMIQTQAFGGQMILQDSSDGNFSIRTTITVVFPNGGESLPGGSQQVIRWQTIGTGFARFRILFARNYIFNDTIAHNVSPAETTYNWTVPTINSNHCLIMVQMIDSSGSIISYDNSNRFFTIISTGIEEFSTSDVKCSILEIYPNPVKSLSNIHYSLPTENKLSLQLYDISGRLVKTIVDEYKIAGNYSLTLNSQTLSAGVYFLFLQTKSNRIIQRLVVIK